MAGIEGEPMNPAKKQEVQWRQAQRLILYELENLKAERGHISEDEAVSYLCSKHPGINSDWISVGVTDFLEGDIHETEISDSDLPF
jgi:hypothetical protein